MNGPMNRDGLLTLSEYDIYANRLVLDTIAKLSAEQLTRESSPSHHSVWGLILHTLEAEQSFLSLCRERPRQPLPELSSVAEIRRHWEQVEQGLRDWIASCRDDDLRQEASLPFKIKGQPVCLPKWQMLMEAFMHSAQHRSELSVVLTELGYPLPNLDILGHFMEQKSQAEPRL